MNNEHKEIDLTDPLRALAFMLVDKEGDLPKHVIDLIEDIIEQERNP